MQAAADLHFRLVSRSETFLLVQLGSEGVEVVVDVVEVFPFSSERKRMSVLVRLPPSLLSSPTPSSTHRLMLLTKGADEVMLPLLLPTPQAANLNVHRHLKEFSGKAMRTLVIAGKQVGLREYEGSQQNCNFLIHFL